MNTQPLWKSNFDAPRYPTLDQDLKVDVVVIGGGITGVSTAHLIANEGLTVALVERNRLGGGETGHTTAHVTYMTDTRLSELARVCGEEKALLAWQAGKGAMEHIRRIANNLGEDVEWREVPGYLVVAESGDAEKEVHKLRQECAMANKTRSDVTFLPSIPPTQRPGLIFNGQMKFHPLKYIHAMAREAARKGALIYEGTQVTQFADKPKHLIANGRKITYGHVVIATHRPLQGNSTAAGATLFQTKLASYSTYVVAARVSNDTLPEMIWSDTADPFHYLRVDRTSEGDIVIFGGEDHKTGQEGETVRCFEQLEHDLSRLIPAAEIIHRWSGQVIETVDGLPYIGAISNDQFVATGFSGNGMTFGTVGAMMARDKIIGRVNGWEETFAPSRKEVTALPTYLEENADFPYHLVKDRIGIEDDKSSTLKKGDGCVMKINGTNAAVYRDDDGALHQLSAVCPHLGCIVTWNEGEHTWDCPCHGSRFTADGTVIAGPAEKPMTALK
ncbi:MAG: FAD-dependent oxidoreductase [Luteolibacter sp.]